MKKVKLIINIILLIILIPILVIASVLIVRSYTDKDNVPSIFGKTPLIVLSGSMEPGIMTGDLIVVDNKTSDDNFKENDVIAFYTDDSRETVVTHRIVRINNEEDGTISYVTKGDNNGSEDEGTVKPSLVLGTYNGVRFQGLGNVAVFLQTTTGMIVVISIPVLIILLSQFMENRQTKKELEELKKQKNK